MTTAAPITSERPRDAASFGGFIPSSAVARGVETLVAALGVEHHADGVAVQLVMLSSAPGLLEWDPTFGLDVHDDQGERYDGTVVTVTSGLGQLTATIWIAPAVPAVAKRLELVVNGVMRVNPGRGGSAGIPRELSDGPWNLVIDLVPERTLADVPDEPSPGSGPIDAGSVPVRAHGMFVDLVPVGQVRMSEDVALCVAAVERYWDRAVLTLVALGSGDDTANAPVIGRADVDVWDDLGHRYWVNPVQGTARDSWSEVALEVVPAIPPDATRLGIRVAEIPRGVEGARRLAIPGPFTFGVRLPAT